MRLRRGHRLVAFSGITNVYHQRHRQWKGPTQVPMRRESMATSNVNVNVSPAPAGPLVGPLLGTSGPLLVSGLLDGGGREGMKGLIRDDTSWSINLGTVPCAGDGCLRYHSRHRSLLWRTRNRSAPWWRASGARHPHQQAEALHTELRGAAPGRPLLSSEGLIMSWQTHAHEWTGCFEGTDCSYIQFTVL